MILCLCKFAVSWTYSRRGSVAFGFGSAGKESLRGQGARSHAEVARTGRPAYVFVSAFQLQHSALPLLPPDFGHVLGPPLPVVHQT